MHTHEFKLKQIRTLGIILTCGALAAGCAGNSVKPMSQEIGPVATTPEQTAATMTNDTQAPDTTAVETTAPTAGDNPMHPATPVVSDAQADETEASVTDADKTPASDDLASAQQPSQMTFYFGFDKTRLDDQDKDIIKEHARFLKANPSLVLEINGHTDHTGPHAYNELLSKERAESVAKVLIGEGIPRSQLVINALADDKPLMEQADPGKNRRVELLYDDMSVVSTK